MTVLNWTLSKDSAAILNDTLVSDQFYRPGAFATKARCIPHLGVIMGCKGALFPMHEIWMLCMNGLAVSGVDALAEVAGPFLAKAYGQIRHRLPEDECAVFLFGWSDASARVVGYAFRFEAGFALERLEDGREIIPGLRGPCPEQWLDIARQQQIEDRALPCNDRDNIGGNLIQHAVILRDGVAQIEIQNFGKLAYVEEDTAQLSERFELQPPTVARWERCKAWLEPSLEYDMGGRTIDDVFKDYIAGSAILLDGARAASLIAPAPFGGETALLIYLIGGDLAEIRGSHIGRIEALAKRTGAKRLLVCGRKGWARALRPLGFTWADQTSPTNWITGKVIT